MSTLVDIILRSVKERWSLRTCVQVLHASAERVGQVKLGRVTHRVTCTWWLLWLAVEMSGWL